MVAWTRPPDQWIKINIDGSASRNPGKIGAGGILGDHTGKLLIAFTSPLREGSNDQTEIGATIFGMTWALELGYRKIILKVDLLLIVNLIMKKSTPQWRICIQMERLQILIFQAKEFKCIHIFREGNLVVDYLSKHRHNLTSPQL